MSLWRHEAARVETVENRTSAREASSQRKGHITCPDANSKQVEIIPVDDFDL